MTFDPKKPMFTGKLRLQTTNPTGQRFYLSYTARADGDTVPTLSSMHTDDPTTLWTTYDAGSGTTVLASDTGLYLAVQEGIDLAILVPEASSASPLAIVPGPTEGQGHITWVDSSHQVLTAFYELFTGAPATLTFYSSGDLAWLAITTTTPGLGTIEPPRSAVGYDLSGVNLTGVDLSRVDCTSARFDKATLAGTNLSGAVLTGASFTGVDLTGTLWGNNISAANADFSGTRGTGMVVPSTGGTGGPCATFDDAKFVGADWSGCDLTNASLKSAVVTGANFSGATLTNANLYNLQAGKSGSLDVPMHGADFSYAYMPDANLQASNLNGANLSYAQIYLKYNGATLTDADLTETNLSGADLTGASFGGLKSTIAGTRFDGAVLFQATFDGVALEPSGTLVPVSMAGAWLENATFTNVTFSEVCMSGARVAVSAGPAGAGVPLFSIVSDVAPYAATLDAKQLPGAFTSPSGVFARAGYDLSSNATVSVVSAGQCWTITQASVRTTPGVEDVVFSIVLASGVLEVYSSGISLVEQGENATTYAVTYTVEATTLPPSCLSAGTRCPNRATKGTNDARTLSWRQMMTASRPSLPAGES